MPTRNGFTLIELLVVIAIVAILAAIAVPSYQGMLQSSAITSQSNAILGFLQLARSEAATRREKIEVCPSVDQASCSGTDLARGAIMMLDRNDTVIKVLPPAVASLTSDGSDSVIFNTDGTRDGDPSAVVAWTVSYSGSAEEAKEVAISSIGRATIGVPTP